MTDYSYRDDQQYYGNDKEWFCGACACGLGVMSIAEMKKNYTLQEWDGEMQPVCESCSE